MKLLNLIRKLFKANETKVEVNPEPVVEVNPEPVVAVNPEPVEVPADAVVTEGGRKLFRHPNGKGTVLVFDYWGVEKQLFIADAAYRAIGCFDRDPSYHRMHRTYVTSNYFYGSRCSMPDFKLYFSRDDKWIQETYYDLKFDGTAKSNTDILMQFENTSAANYCRSVELEGVGKCDLPNLYELIILFLESDNIDALDPTIEDSYNRSCALGRKNRHGRFSIAGKGGVVSSSEAFTGDDNYAMVVRSIGYVRPFYQYDVEGVVPVKELN